MTLDDVAASGDNTIIEVQKTSLLDIFENEAEMINDSVESKLREITSDLEEKDFYVNDPLEYELWLKQKAYKSLAKKFSVYREKYHPLNSSATVAYTPLAVEFYKHISDNVPRTNIDYYKNTLDFLQVAEPYKVKNSEELLKMINMPEKDFPALDKISGKKSRKPKKSSKKKPGK